MQNIKRRKERYKSAKSNYFECVSIVKLWAKYFYTLSKNSFIVCGLRKKNCLQTARNVFIEQSHTRKKIYKREIKSVGSGRDGKEVLCDAI